ncbi:MAG: efflux transporter outer membrane subunit [Verrucomicrobia bacterium]|nr:efflux transporter outer membrane subunit [Verrucomicrobiota bacterium]
MKHSLFLILGGFALVTAGCTLAPKYERPAAPVAAAWPSGPAYASAGVVTAAPAAPELPWREFFTDPKLRQVIDGALANNRDLRLASLNVELARSLYGIQRDQLFPALNASAGASKQRTSGELTQSGQRLVTERYDVAAGVFSWEIDLFGRLRSLKGRALEEYLATEQARRGAQTLLVSAVASAYLTLAADREALALAQATLEAQQQAYRLVQRLHASGVATELDLRQAQIPVEASRAEVARFKQRVAQDENALNLLAGAPVSPEWLPASLGSVGATREIGAGVPSDVLLRRPDVMQAEAMLRAANADLGAARAALFPRISLTSTLGSASRELDGLFHAGTRTWSFVPQLVAPIFDQRTWSALAATKVQQKLVLTQYERAIQNAFREVADALAVRGPVEEQLAAQQALVQSQSEVHRLASARFARGVDSYLVVLDAQRSLFAAQQAVVSLRLASAVSQVRLYAVLGGGGDGNVPGERMAQATPPAAAPR